MSLIFRFPGLVELSLEPLRGIGGFGGKTGCSDLCLNNWLLWISSSEAGGGWRGTPCGCLGGLLLGGLASLLGGLLKL